MTGMLEGERTWKGMESRYFFRMAGTALLCLNFTCLVPGGFRTAKGSNDIHWT